MYIEPLLKNYNLIFKNSTKSRKENVESAAQGRHPIIQGPQQRLITYQSLLSDNMIMMLNSVKCFTIYFTPNSQHYKFTNPTFWPSPDSLIL